MKIVSTVSEVRAVVKEWKRQGLSVGLVPTMGFLHAGHKSLIARSVKENEKTVVSIFVNPIQFGPKEDLAAYPRDLMRDSALCESADADLIFAPQPGEMYAEDFATYIDISGVSEELCGAARPGHFRGVCTVVGKLFNIIAPHKSYFGEKDAQQLAVIKRMTRDLNFDVEIAACPIVREADGLAMSSRNTYLNAEERKAALCLYRAVLKGKEMLASGEKDARKIEETLKEQIAQEPLARVDYVRVVDADTINPVSKIAAPVLCALAVFIGKTRLIDNFSCEVK